MPLKSSKKSTAEFLIFVGPLLFLYILFFIYPLLDGFLYSFTNWNGLSKNISATGIENYVRAFGDIRFTKSIVFTFSYTLFYVVLVNFLGLGAAVVMDMQLRTQNALKSMLFAPYVLNIVTVGFIWQFVFGRLFIGLSEATGFPLFGLSMLGDSKNVLAALTIVKIWQSLGYFMVIYMAGLKSIPEELLESASVEGATAWYRFFKVKLPLLMPSVTVCIFTALVNGLRVFELIMTLTNGGPGTASESMALNIYNEAYEKGNFGYASAKSVILLAIIAVFTIIQLNFFKKREVEA